MMEKQRRNEKVLGRWTNVTTLETLSVWAHTQPTDELYNLLHGATASLSATFSVTYGGKLAALY